MSLYKTESADNLSDGNSSNRQLLCDIEAISKALYFPKPPPKALISPYDNRSKSAERIHSRESTSNQSLGIFNENVLNKSKKSSSLWNWKKPLKALAHIGRHKCSVCFFLHVHSVEGLPVNFNDISLCVHWKRKDDVLRTRPSRVSEGNAEFEETLMHKCYVFVSRSGPHNSAKYEAKFSLICASVVGAPGIDIGKHWVDLTRLLPLTLEELEGEKSSGKWTTSFKLIGKAEGATLNVSFGFSVMQDNFVEPKNVLNVSELINLSQNRSTTLEPSTGFGTNNGKKILRRVGSVPSNLDNRSAFLTTSLDVKVCEEVSPILGLELSKSVSFLYEKLNEANIHGSERFDLSPEHVEPPNNLTLHPAKDIGESENDYAEFTVVEWGIETPESKQLKSEQKAVHLIDNSVIETIDVEEIIKDEHIALDEEIDYNLKESSLATYVDGVELNDSKDEETAVCSRGLTLNELESVFSGLLTSELADLESPLAIDKFLGQENYMEVQSNYRASKMSKKSLSLDDVSESVAADFLDMLGIEHASFGFSSDGDPESPRERLLRVFEKEALASGNSILGFDLGEDHVQFSSVDQTGSGCGHSYEDFDLSPVIQGSEEEHKREGESLKNRRKANILEDLETESLMREWGLSERAFQSSPRYCSGGFGSPVELPPEDPFELPPLGDDFGPFVQTKGGGFLQSMNPSLFRNVKNVGSLIMQISRPIVLPAEMGSEIIDILKHLASVGIKKLSMQVNKLMPLEDITGKMLEEVAQEAAPSTVVSERQASLQHGSLWGQDSFDRRVEDEEFQFGWSYDNKNSCLNSVDMGSGYVTFEDLPSLAMGRIEAMLIEGLRIQSGMSDEDAPSHIRIHSVEKNFNWRNANFFGFLNLEGTAELQPPDINDGADDVYCLMDFSVTLDEWLKLDSGIISDGDNISEHTFKILAAHHAKCIDRVNGTLTRHLHCDKASGKTHGLLGNNLTVCHMVLLRDPLRNYEPVGTSMLALFQMERVFLPFKLKLCSRMLDRNEEKDNEANIKEGTGDKGKEEKGVEEENIPCFKITEVHLSGLNNEIGTNQLWGTKTQQQSGSRWLLNSGMAKSNKHPFSKSKAIVISRGQGARNSRNEHVLWSITSNVPEAGAHPKDLAALVPHVRNPNIVFPNESTRSHVACNF